MKGHIMSIDKTKTNTVESPVKEDSKPETTTIEDSFKTVKGYLFNAFSGVVKVNRNQATDIRNDHKLINAQLVELGHDPMTEKQYIERKFSSLFKKVPLKSNGFKTYEFKGVNNGGLKNATEAMKTLYSNFIKLVSEMPESVEYEGNWYLPDSNDDYKRPQFSMPMRKNDNLGNDKDAEQKRINEEIKAVLDATLSELTPVKEQPEINPINQ